MANEKKVYEYHGPVNTSLFGIRSIWLAHFDGETTATNAAQAAIFFTYRAKEYGLKRGYTLDRNATIILHKNLIKEVVK